MTSDSLVQLAKRLAPDVSARLRVGTITALVGDKVRTDVTDTSLVTTNSDSKLAVGDRVVLLQQRSVWIVAMRVSGSYPVAPVQTPIGSMTAFAGTTPPTGWLLCDGSAVSRTTYPELFAVCGTRYGAGDGSTTFGLPNLTARVPLGPGNGRTGGETGGAETVTLTAAQMPSHTHTGPAHTHTLNHTHSVPRGGGATTVASGTGASVASTASTTSGSESNGTTSSSGTGNTGSAGSGASHENMPPYQVVAAWVIRAR